MFDAKRWYSWCNDTTVIVCRFQFLTKLKLESQYSSKNSPNNSKKLIGEKVNILAKIHWTIQKNWLVRMPKWPVITSHWLLFAVLDIYRYGQKLGDDICRSLLFIHAFTGCETLQFCTKGKGMTFKALLEISNLYQFVEIRNTKCMIFFIFFTNQRKENRAQTKTKV